MADAFLDKIFLFLQYYEFNTEKIRWDSLTSFYTVGETR